MEEGEEREVEAEVGWRLKDGAEEIYHILEDFVLYQREVRSECALRDSEFQRFLLLR